MKTKKGFKDSKEKKGWTIFKTNSLIRIKKENKKTAIKIFFIILICALFSLMTIIFLLPILMENNLFQLALYIHYSMWMGCLFLISYLIVKKSDNLKGFIIATDLIVVGMVIGDLIAQMLGLYDDANYFFKLRIDLLSHFLAGTIFFLVIVMLLSLCETKYRIDILAFIFTNLILFLYEIFEEILDLFYGTMSAQWQHSFSNPFFWNSIQDMIMNFIGSMTAYLISRRYIRKRIKF